MSTTYVVDSDGCWIWQGATDHGGYPKAKREGRTVNMFKWMFEQKFGFVESDQDVHHKCHKKLCINPDCGKAIHYKIHRKMNRSRGPRSTQ